MKKYLSLFLVAIMLLALLISCTVPQDTNTNSSDSESTNDTNSDNAGDNNTDLPDDPTEPPDDNQPDDPVEPTEKTHTAAYQFNYSYNHVFESETNEPLAYLLIEHSNLGRGFDNIVIPDDITAGDTITIEYTGATEHFESYPGVISLSGELKSYSFGYAEVTHLEGNDFSIEKIKDCYDYKDAYVILDKSGRFVKLDEYTGNEIYLVTDQTKLYGDNLGSIQDLPAPLKHPVACMLAYNPRDLEDGLSSNEEITIEQAIEIAECDFYWNYAEDGDGFEYIMKMGNHNAEQWIILFNKEYFSGTHIPTTYRYAIDKRTGEIAKVEIAE